MKEDLENDKKYLENDKKDLEITYKTIFPQTKIQLVESELKKFGLRKLQINDKYSIEDYYDLIIENVDSLLDYVNIFTLLKDNKYEFTYLNSDNVEEKKIFNIVVSDFMKGGNNKVYKCTDENGKQYILIKNYIGNIKFIPQVHYIGIKKSSNGTFQTWCIIEEGPETLEKYIMRESLINTQKIFLRIYNALFLIEDKLRIGFKHNDLKFDNVLISLEGKPLIIDFGFAKFNLDGIDFESINLCGKHAHYDIESYFGYNIVHDIIFLMMSLYWTKYEEPLKIFNFKKNKGTSILDSPVLIDFFTKFCTGKIVTYKDSKLDTKIPFQADSFYKRISELDSNDLIFIRKVYRDLYEDILELDKLPKSITIFINPDELADNMELTILTDDDYGKFERKYRKYKAKYLALKKIKLYSNFK